MKNTSQFTLLTKRRFAPLFVTQFMGAFHDNLFKNAMVVLLLFGAGESSGDGTEEKLLTTLAAGLFILPFVLFSALGGQLADKYPKDRVIRWLKIAEIGIAVLGAAALLSGFLPLCFLALFLLGTHSAIFGPSKYSILPQHLQEGELIGGNALLSTGTYLAILLGTIAGTALMGLKGGAIVTGVGILACALSGYAASRSIPPAPAKDPSLKIDFNPVTETAAVLREALAQPRRVFRALMGNAWFYFMGGMFLAQIPNFTKDALSANQNVLGLFLVIFSVGIGAGGLLNNRLLRGRIEATYVPLAMLAISLASIDLYFACAPFQEAVPQALHGIGIFFAQDGSWRITFDIAMVAIAGGLFVVPLVSIIQHDTPEDHRARIIAGSGILDSLFMVASSVVSGAMIARGWEIRTIFLFFAVTNAGVALYICKLLPDYLLKSLLQGLFKTLYRVEVRGLENAAKAGKRAVIVGNHVSFLDPPLLAAFLPGRPMFAVNTQVAQYWWVRPFLRIVDAFPLDPGNPFSMKGLIRKVEQDRHVVIFPEGRLTETGALMKVYDGPGMIADKAGATILPVRLDGVQHSFFSRLQGKMPLRRFPKIIISFLEPRTFKIDPALRGRARRAAAGRQLYDLMEEMMFLTGDREQTLWQALLRARAVHGGDAVVAEDVERKPVAFKKLVGGALVLGRKFSGFTEKGENVGLMLPNSLGALTAFFALQAYGRVPAMLNFSAGTKAILSACRTARIKTVITSRRFVEMGKLEGLIEQIGQTAAVIYLEDIRRTVTAWDRLHALLAAPAHVHKRLKIDPHDPAVVLFTSGSEGEPKGVALSHANLMTNIVQLTSRVDFNRQDIVFNCLPMFHSFGLTGGMLLPVLSGVKTFLYPSPLHYRIVPELVYSSNATIMFGTDTFLNGYARMADPYDFYRMRYIFAGAEKVRDETRRLYMERFGVQVLEGYGTTETAPVIAVNSAMHNKNGTVGRFLSGVEVRLEDVPGVSEGKRLYVRGPNVMRGYYLSENPGVLKPPPDGWHDTGDIVSVDADGFVTIRGRAKRFAKIAGEMVSLTLAETVAQAVWPDAQHAVIALPDPRKGEQLVLVTTQENATRDALSAHAAQNGISALAVPATILHAATLPVLGSGKTDYASLTAMVIANKFDIVKIAV